jgi:hypothetical protein
VEGGADALVCGSCGEALAPSARFCAACGQPAPTGASAAGRQTPATATAAGPAGPAAVDTAEPPATGNQQDVGELLRSNPVVGAIVVFVVSMVLAQLLWPLLSAPAQIIGELFTVGNCIGTSQDELWACSARVAVSRAAGSIVMIVVAIVFRRPLQKKVRELTKKLAPGARFLVSPMLATSMFTMVYGDLHSDTAATNGYVSQKTFPALVGTLTFLAVRFGPKVTQRFPGFFGTRDKVPMFLRLIPVLLLPLALSYRINQPTPGNPYLQDTAKKEQLVILVSLASTYLAVLPTSG